MFPLEMLMGSGFIGVGLGVLAWAGSDLWDSGLDYLERDFKEKFRRLRVRVKRLRTIILSWLAMVGVFFATMWVFLNLPVLGFVAAVIVFCLPWYLVRRMARRRKVKIEDQLADAMVSMASAIQAGLSLAQSLEILAEQSPHPISQEFQQMMTEYQLGKTLDEVLEGNQRTTGQRELCTLLSRNAGKPSEWRTLERCDRTDCRLHSRDATSRTESGSRNRASPLFRQFIWRWPLLRSWRCITSLSIL